MENNKWKIIHDMDNDDGTPNCWAKKINHNKYGEYVWINKTKEGFNVEVKQYNDFTTLVTCKTLTSAKRWVSINMIEVRRRKDE